MDAVNPFKTTGWEKAARVNCTILVLLSVAMITLSGAALSHGAQTALFLYSGDCNSGNTTTINLVLHLLINAVSTLVAQELHYWLLRQWVSHETRANLITYSVLALSSIPIHLLFNSTVFRTDYRGADFHLTIATEEFTKGGTYFPPGASLQFPGLSPHGSNWSEVGDCCSWAPGALGKLSALATQAGKWKRLDINECRQEYASCKGVKKYSNIRDDMRNLGKDQRLFWDKYIPPKQANHFFYDTQCAVRTVTTYNLPGACRNRMHYALSEPRPSALDISVDYCLAQPLKSTCMPLITPGDAIASFITKPDEITIGYCTMGHEKIQKIVNYSSITIGISVAIGLFIIAVDGALKDSSDIARGGFFPSDNSPLITLDFTLITAVLLANSPQLLLTFCYFAYNNIFTHLQSALEWARFSNTFSPLRVTDPKGQQLSTYRLQLPYRYSLFLIISRYYWYYISRRDASLPPDAAILVGYSPTALLTLILVAVFLALIPPIWSSIKRLPPNMAIPGCNSLALSAACHVFRRSHSRDASFELLGGNTADSSICDAELEEMDERYLEKLAQSKLRWSVIDMPPEWYTEHGYDPALVGHLGFGALEGGGVAAPLWGHLYA
ncbi:hypothetical protein GGR58DRAFT_529658 [Xylaria digitata]|nr:hypothetical protein GGR58DRAFT_529658 [Xylaria digitata]